MICTNRIDYNLRVFYVLQELAQHSLPLLPLPAKSRDSVCTQLSESSGFAEQRGERESEAGFACYRSRARQKRCQTGNGSGSPLEMPRTPIKKLHRPCMCGCACISSISRVDCGRPGDGEISAANRGAVTCGMLGCRCSLVGPVAPLGPAFTLVHCDVGATQARAVVWQSASRRLLFEEDAMKTNTGDIIMAVNTRTLNTLPSPGPASSRAAPTLIHGRQQQQQQAPFLSHLAQSTPVPAAKYSASINMASQPNQSQYNEEDQEAAAMDGQPATHFPFLTSAMHSAHLPAIYSPAAHHIRPNMVLNQPGGESEPAYCQPSTALAIPAYLPASAAAAAGTLSFEKSASPFWQSHCDLSIIHSDSKTSRSSMITRSMGATRPLPPLPGIPEAAATTQNEEQLRPDGSPAAKRRRLSTTGNVPAPTPFTIRRRPLC